MTTKVSICSAAIGELGRSPIASFDESSDVARLCANLYDTNRDALLRSHLWNCAVRSETLSPIAMPTGFSNVAFSNAFLLPGDWLRTIRLGSTRDSSNTCFRQEGRYLLTDSDSIVLRYVWRNEDPGTYDALLIQVLTALMKWRMTYALTKSTSLRDSNMQEYRLLLQQAKSIDSMEEPGDMVAEDTPLISARY